MENKDYLKELLNTYRADKGYLWTSLIVSVGGTIGLIIRAFNVKHKSSQDNHDNL